MKLKLIASAVCLATAMFSANAAVKSVDMKPLHEKVSVNEQSVRSDSTLPQILWGADAVTMYANGNDKSTVRGSVFDKSGLNFDLELTNSLAQQAQDYISGKTPYFRGTLDQVAQLNDLVWANKSLRPVVLQQL